MTGTARRRRLSVGAALALLFSFVGLTAGVTPAFADLVLPATTTIVTTSPAPAIAGENIQICATVSADLRTPTGSVNFTVPGRHPETVALNSGEACFTTTSILVSGMVTADYDGSPDFAGSEGTLPLTVNKAATTTVVVEPQPTVTGQLNRFWATVTVDPPSFAPITGSVVFTGPDGFMTAAAPTSRGACFFTSTATSGTLTATFTGNPWLQPSTGTGTMIVNPAATTTAVTLSADPSTDGETVEACATVTVTPFGQGTPTGTVSFSGPGGLNGTAVLPAASAASPPRIWPPVPTPSPTTATPSSRDRRQLRRSPCFRATRPPRS